MFKKIQYVYLLKKYIKWGVWRVVVCPSYIQDARFLKVKSSCNFLALQPTVVVFSQPGSGL